MNTPELETLGRYLDTYRDVVKWKLVGVTDEDARRPIVPSGTSLLNVVKHLAYVERWWFQAVIAGDDVDIPWHDDPDADWRLESEDTIASVVALYDAECAKSRAILDVLDDPDELRDREGRDPVSIRRILIHMVEEVARHAGHMDIARELIDGATGDFPGEG